jgi:PAS domain S-box-containing protein
LGSGKTSDGAFDRSVRLLAAACACAAGALAFFVLLAWLTGNWIEGTLGPDYVAMAPSTACLMILLSVAAFLRRFPRSGCAGRFMVRLAVATIAATVLLSWTRRFLGLYYPATEEWLDAVMIGAVGVSFGPLSPLTMTALVITAIALFLDLSPPDSGLLRRHLGPLLATAAFIIALVVILSYSVGTPVLYGTHATPMALPTALCLALINAAISLQAHASMWAVPTFVMGHFLNPSRRRQYRLAFAALFVLFAFIVGTAGGLYLQQQEAAMHQMAQGKLEAVADALVGQIVNWQTERMDDAQTFAAAPLVARVLGRFLTGPDPESAREDVLNGLHVLNVGSRYRQIAVYDSGLTPRVGTSPDLPMPGAYLRSMFSRAIRERRVVMTDLRTGEGQDVYIDFLAPVFAPGGDFPDSSSGVIAVVLFRVDAGRFLSPLERIWPRTDPTTEVVLVRRDGKDMVSLSQKDPKARTPQASAIKSSDVPGAMAVRGESGIAEGLDYRAVPVVAAVRPIGGTPWAIVAKMDDKAIYAPSRHQALQAGSILFLLVLAMGLTVGVLWRQRNLAWYRDALALEKEHSALAQRFEQLMRHANDIILLAGDDETIREANDRALASYGASLSALRRMKLSELCTPSTRRESLLRTRQIKTEGSTLYEGVHRRSDGSTFAVEVSGSAVNIDGESCLLVMVRDISERERAAEALRASEQNFRTLFDSMQDFLFVVDLGGDIRRVNETVVARLGYTKEELIGKSLLLLHPQDRREEASRILEDMVSGRTNICSVPLLARDGLVIPVETHIVTGLWSGQEVMFGVSRDISALRASEEKFIKVFQNTPAVMAISTIDDGRYQEVNDAFLETLGFAREEVIGKTSRELNMFQDPGQRGVIRKTILETGVLRNMEVVVRRKDGQFRNGLFSGEIIKVQDEWLLLTVMNDVTDRKRAEEALLLIRKAVDSTSDAIGIANPNGVHFYQNQALTELFGYTIEEFKASGGPTIVYDDDNVAREVFGAIRQGHSWKGETMMVAKDGRRFPVLLRADAVKDEQGRTIGLIGAHTDISERKVREDERQHLLEQTQRDARTKAELLAEVNHRVKNNLTSILGLILGEKQHMPAGGRAHVVPVLDSLSLRIRGLLQVHQMLSDAHWSPMRLSDLAERVIRAALVAVPRGRAVSVTVRPSAVQISPRQAGSMAMVLNELAVNTAKHALEGRAEANIVVGAGMEGAIICLEYWDDGPGYPEAVLNEGGGNVGMHLVRQLVSETLRGTVDFSNKDGAVAVLRIKTEDTRHT